MRATLQSSRWLSGDVREVVLSPHAALRYRPGQYVGIARTNGERRCYSMARAPSDDNRIALHVRRWPGGRFSDLAMTAAAVGDEFELTGPLGAFAFPEGTGPIVMLATGTGIAPFLAMLECFLPGHPLRAIRLYWGVRAAGDLYAADLLDQWQSRFPHFRFVPVLSSRGDGYVQQVAARELRDATSTHVLACGQPQMIADAHARLVTTAVEPVASFTSDAFEPAVDEAETASTAPVAPVAPVAESAASALATTEHHTVRLFVDGRRLDARNGESVLGALKAARLPVMSVCGGKASCGTCVVEVDAAWVDRLTPCSRTERNLLGCLPDITASSRLGCQLRLTRALDGLAIRLPNSHPTPQESSV